MEKDESRKKNGPHGKVRCSFCGKTNSPRTQMLVGNHGAVICSACAKAFLDACKASVDGASDF